MTAPQPPYGPLTSTEHLLPGDLVRVIAKTDGPKVGDIYPLICTVQGFIQVITDKDPKAGAWSPTRFAFIGRPAPDGWIAAPDGGWPENPCPGYRVEWRNENGNEDICESDVLSGLGHPLNGNSPITAIRILGLDAGEGEAVSEVTEGYTFKLGDLVAVKKRWGHDIGDKYAPIGFVGTLIEKSEGQWGFDKYEGTYAEWHFLKGGFAETEGMFKKVQTSEPPIAPPTPDPLQAAADDVRVKYKAARETDDAFMAAWKEAEALGLTLEINPTHIKITHTREL